MKETDQRKKKIKEVERLLAEVKSRLKSVDKKSQSLKRDITLETTPSVRQKPREEDEKSTYIEKTLPSDEERQVEPEKKFYIEETLPSEPELQSEYERLYEEFVVKNFKAIKEFIKGKNRIYLRAFCKVNNMPLDANKASKDRIVDEVMQWMSRRRAIARKVT